MREKFRIPLGADGLGGNYRVNVGKFKTDDPRFTVRGSSSDLAGRFSTLVATSGIAPGEQAPIPDVGLVEPHLLGGDYIRVADVTVVQGSPVSSGADLVGGSYAEVAQVSGTSDVSSSSAGISGGVYQTAA